jgi:2-isopropylmalate synthase
MAKEKQNLYPRRVEIYDTTLRDGAQAAEISFSVIDKIRIAERLAEIGIHYIEGGWPGANPRDDEFFRKMRSRRIGRTRLVAFGSTVNPKNRPESDPAVRALLQAGTGAVTIVGKSWDLHLKKALRIGLERNLEIIGSTLSYLRPRVDRLFFDAEHYFDGYRENSDYALETIRAAAGAGADAVVLCDTNGGTLPFELAEIFARARAGISVPLGIHTHNDSELAVANTLAAVRLGAVQVQGTINGIGSAAGTPT